MNNVINEIEFNFCNACSANCFVCSKYHGDKNSTFMHPDVFNVAVSQLNDIQFKRIHTSGNGDAFINPNFIPYLRTLRNEFPDKTIDFYSNFYLFTSDMSDIFINENLVDEVHIRWDSLHKWIFEKSTKLNYDTTIKNLEYFLFENTKIKIFINYGDIRTYYKRVQESLGEDVLPAYSPFTSDELSVMRNEYDEIRDYFNSMSNTSITYTNLNYVLWAERLTAPLKKTIRCPKYNVINNTIWICPDGRISICPYDDRQDNFIYGDIHNDTLLSIWNSQSRKDLLFKIDKQMIEGYPCTNPILCLQKGLNE